MQVKLQSLKKFHGQGGAKVSMRMLEVPSPLKVVRMRHPARGTKPAWYKIYIRKRLFGRCVPITGSQLQDTPVPPPHGQTVGRGYLCHRHLVIGSQCTGPPIEGFL